MKDIIRDSDSQQALAMAELHVDGCVAVHGGRAVTTTVRVADIFGKRHGDVLKVFERLGCSQDFNQRNFAPISYADERGRTHRAFEMTKDGFVFLVMGFTGKKAAAFKEAYIAAFNEMEKALVPQTITPDQQRHIQKLVGQLAKQPGNSYAGVWASLKDKFKVARYDQISVELYDDACHFLSGGERLPQAGTVSALGVSPVGDCADGERLARGFQLATEVAQKVSAEVFKSVVTGDGSWVLDRWLFCFHSASDGELIPHARMINRRAGVATLEEMASRIGGAGVHATNGELTQLAQACLARLQDRAERGMNPRTH